MIGETNINGGGGFNGKKALIKIQAQTGSIITVSKDSSQIVVKKSIILDNNWSLWFFETNNFGTWTVTATLRNEYISDIIIIDGNKQYDLTLDFSLPNSYQKVGYIQSSGTQYIITDTALKDITKFTVIFSVPTTTTMNMILGSRDAGTDELNVGCYTSSSYDMKIYWRGAQVTSIGTMNQTTTYNMEADIITRKAVVNNIEYNFSGTVGTLSSPKIAIFGLNRNDGTVGALMKAKLFSLSFYNGDDPVEEFTPCYRISDSVVGLWGRYAKKLYTNDGTGVFTAGPDV